jgi:transcriptional regulator with XRE-family HTH domain
MEDGRVGLAIRAMRRRRGWRQLDLARAAGVSQTHISAIERGHVRTASLQTIRWIVGALDGRVDFGLRWRGADLDRLLDERHAVLVDAIIRRLTHLGWLVRPEVTYDYRGMRGSFDLLAFHPVRRALINGEAKTELASVEATLRKQDEKARLAIAVARDRFAWQADRVGRLLILPEQSTARRQVARHAAVFEAALPARGAEVHAWLRVPDRNLAGVWFLSLSSTSANRRTGGGPRRVRVASSTSRAPRPLPLAARCAPSARSTSTPNAW